MDSASNPRLKFLVAEKEFKVFRNILRCLHKIGPLLMIEATPNETSFLALNTSQTGHMSITCNAGFFQEYNVFGCRTLNAVVLFKNVLAPFRSQRVESAAFELCVNECRLTTTLECENGLVKRYSFPTTDDEVVKASNVEGLPVKVVVEPSSMVKYLSTFHSGVAEVALVAHRMDDRDSGPSVDLRSHLDPAKSAGDQSLHAMLKLNGSMQFVSYENNTDSLVEIIFNVKDFKAFLALSDSLKADVQLNCIAPGRPLVLTSRNGQDDFVKAKLILSTVDSGEGATQEDADMYAAPVGPSSSWQPQQQSVEEEVAEDVPMDPWKEEEEDEEIGIASTPPDYMGGRSGMPGLISTAPGRS